ncbi:hypothetical protein UlMin_041884 [Ulmus minor]
MSTSHSMAETVWKEIESTGSVTNEYLHFLFGKNFERATRIVDQRGVKRVSGQPKSRRKEEYACFPENLCACYSFFYDIVNRGEQVCGCGQANYFSSRHPRNRRICCRIKASPRCHSTSESDCLC